VSSDLELTSHEPRKQGAHGRTRALNGAPNIRCVPAARAAHRAHRFAEERAERWEMCMATQPRDECSDCAMHPRPSDDYHSMHSVYEIAENASRRPIGHFYMVLDMQKDMLDRNPQCV